MPVESRRLGHYLVANGIMTGDQLDWAMAREAPGRPLAAVPLEQKLASEKQLLAAAADQMGMPFVDFSLRPPRPSMAEWMTEQTARRAGAVPVELDGTTLIVAVSDPTDRKTIDWLGAQTGLTVVPALASPDELAQAIDDLYPPSPSHSPSPSPSHSPSPGLEASGAGPARAPGVVTPRPAATRVDALLERVVQIGGSDLHLSAGLPPGARVNGEIVTLSEFESVDGDEIERMVLSILTDKQRATFKEELELDTSHTIPGIGRFRVNVFQQRNSVGAVIRVIPFEVPPFESLGLPPTVASLATLPRGLVVVTGPTGSGKSTTLASLIDIINASRQAHIMTVEDPIEFLHAHKRSVVNQREVGEDTQSFASALKHVLRQDPDVILVGEMRDLETMSTALTAAETGHLVFGTLHTQSAPQSIDRIIDVFPAHQQQQIRTQLSTALQAVVTQQLVPTAAAGGRVLAVEVLIATAAIRNLIREGKTHQVASTMQSGGKFGMQTMDQALADLVRSRTITMETALQRCQDPEDLRRLAGSS